MIQLSKYSDYGIVILSYLAKLNLTNDATLLSAKTISEKTHISLPMVSKILKTLVKGGLLKSHQGVKGGYQLLKQPSQVSIAEIVEIMDGPLALTECSLNIPGACKTENLCSVKPHWSIINSVIRNALRSLPLSNMAAPAAEMDFSVGQLGLLMKQERQ